MEPPPGGAVTWQVIWNTPQDDIVPRVEVGHNLIGIIPPREARGAGGLFHLWNIGLLHRFCPVNAALQKENEGKSMAWLEEPLTRLFFF